MIVCALQMERAQHAVKAFAATPGVASLTPTTAGQARPVIIGCVGIESLFDGAGGQLQSLVAHGHFQRLQVQFVDGLAPHERLNLVHDVGGQERGE